MFGTTEVSVDGESDVVVAKTVAWTGMEVAVELCTIPPLPFLLLYILWSVFRIPRVKFVAPTAEPVPGERSLDDCFYGFTLLKAVLARVYVVGECIRTKGVVDVAT